MRVLEWQGMYDKSWKGLLTDESRKHPAKFSRALVEKIFEHGEAEGYFKPGDIVLDPFFGVATGGVVGALKGYKMIGVELEPRFVELANQNLELHRAYLEEKGLPMPLVVQGDSRSVFELVSPLIAEACVTSPPFAGNGGGTGVKSSQPMNDKYPGVFERHLGSKNNKAAYGDQEGQINNLPQGAVTSPPFGKSTADGGWQMLGKYAREGKLKVKQVKGDANKVYPSWDEKRDTDYAPSPQNIGNLDASITSPPYAELNLRSGGWNVPGVPDPRFHGYGEEDGQVGNLADGAVTSPPFGERLAYPDVERGKEVQRRLGKGGTLHQSPGQETGQVAQLDSSVPDSGSGGETYWQAVSQIYAGVFELLRPGGVMAVVVKNYVKGGVIVPFCEATAYLLEQIGFTVLDEVHAMMVKDTGQSDMFTGETKKISRKSFFRRLAEKRGLPAIDFEVVYFVKKP